MTLRRRNAWLVLISLLLVGASKPNQTAGKPAETPTKALEATIARLKKERADRGYGWILVGQVVVGDDKRDARDVWAQMPILEGGYFADLIENTFDPVGFALDGYDLVRVMPRPVQGQLMIDAGKVTLTPLPESRASALKGRLLTKKGEPVAGASIDIAFHQVPVNNFSNGHSSRPKWNASTIVKTDAEGRFETRKELCPIGRFAFIRVEGFDDYQKVFELPAGATTDLGELRMGRKARIALRFRVAPTGDFRNVPTKEETLITGMQWIAAKGPNSWAKDLEVVKTDGGLKFNASYAPAFMRALGSGSFEQYASKTYDDAGNVWPGNLWVEKGLTYLLKQDAMKHWVLLQVVSLDADP